MKLELSDRRALVTGGGRGIGKAIAEALGAAGARVAVLARTREEVEAVAAEIARGGGDSLALVADLGDARGIGEAIGEVLQTWGGVDILVNNAAILGPIGRSDQVDAQAWSQAVQVNLVGSFACTQLVLPGMIERRSGKIVNLSGGGAVSPRPYFSAYGASKAGLVRYTETLAAEVAEFGIDVNAMAPGAVNTSMLDEVLEAGEAAGAEAARRARQQTAAGGEDPARAAALAVYLASPRSDGLSGRLLSAVWDSWENLDVDAVMSSDAFTVRRLKPDTR